MSDRLVQMGRSPALRRAASTVGVSLPPTLPRADGPWSEQPLKDRAVLVMLADGSTLGAPIAETLARAGAEPAVLGPLEPFAAAGEALARPARAATPTPAKDDRVDAIVFDASGVETVDQLRQLHTLLHPWIRSVRRRVVVLGRPPASTDGVEARACQRALDGFTRSLAKELGRKGATANLISVTEGAEDRLEPLLRWLLSDRSAYISGQPFVLTAEVVASKARYLRPLGGQVALVTGSARGIGEATARALAAEGAQVIVLDRPGDREAAEAVADSIGGLALLVDVTDADAPAQIADFVEEHFVGIDIVVHNAGVTRDKTLGGMKAPLWDLVLDVNLRALLRINERLVPLIRDGGRMICLSSIGGIAGNVGQTNYAATKAGVIGLVEALAPQLAGRGIAVNAVAPGFIETRMTAAIPIATREVARRMANLGQGGLPEDIAATITFLASPGACGLCGRVVRACGGNLIGA
ncbi:MAG: 3-oxoacyl-[acyl-carrier protein] reductase [Myxococcota bacterium]|jgi:3-oxoacyl-[acyl-carrier protein] reductase